MMRNSICILVFIGVLVSLSTCKTKTAIADEMLQSSNTPEPSRSPTPEVEEVDDAELPVRPLNKTQKKELDRTLPPKVRDVLEKANNLEVLGLSSEEKAGIGWYPDMRATLGIGPERKELLDAFYYDASAGPNPSACFIPRHSLRATYKSKTVEVIICYQCHLFTVQGDLGEFDGGMYMDGSAAHRIFHRFMSQSGEPIK